MDNLQFDGKTKNALNRRKEPNCQDDRNRVERFAESGSIVGAEKSDRLTARDSFWSNSCRSNRPKSGKVYPGKILERVEYLERQFLDYVHAHQSRLEIRLGESKQTEQNFLEVIQQLKDELLASQSDEADSEELNSELASEQEQS